MGETTQGEIRGETISGETTREGMSSGRNVLLPRARIPLGLEFIS